MEKYPISSYNKYVCLKPNALILMICLFLLRPYALEILSIANIKDRSALINMFYTDKLLLSFEAAAAIPIIFLVYAWTRRSPDASEFTKKIWRYGKQLIMATTCLQLCIVSSPLWLQIESHMTRFSWVQLLICLSILLITPFSRYMRDCFADFPESDQGDV